MRVNLYVWTEHEPPRLITFEMPDPAPYLKAVADNDLASCSVLIETFETTLLTPANVEKATGWIGPLVEAEVEFLDEDEDDHPPRFRSALLDFTNHGQAWVELVQEDDDTWTSEPFTTEDYIND